MKITDFSISSGKEILQCVVAEASDQMVLTSAPTVIIPSCRNGWDSLYTHPFNIFTETLIKFGIRVVSFMTPCHGDRVEGLSKIEIAGFAEMVASGRDPFEQYIEDAKNVTTEIINQYGPSALYTMGGSRTGYLALRHAATDKRIKGVSVTCPVTDWSFLSEFHEVPQNSILLNQSLTNYTDSLSDIPISIIMGNDDTRVSTLSCINFYSDLIKKSKVPTAILKIVDSEEHSLPDAEWENAALFIQMLSLNEKHNYERETPFYASHNIHGASMCLFHNWKIPAFYSTGVEVELEAFSSSAALIDMKYRGLIWIRGPQAYQTVKNIFGEEVTLLNDGKGLSFDINDTEGKQESSIGMIYAYSHQNYCVRVDAPYVDQIFKFLHSNNSLNAIIEDHSKCFSTIGIYGLKAESILSLLPWNESINSIQAGSLRDVNLRESSFIVERTQNQLGNGFEISGNKKELIPFWDELILNGKPHKLTLVGHNATELRKRSENLSA